MRYPGSAALGSASIAMQTGLATLVAGSVAIAAGAKIDANSIPLLTRMTAGGGPGHLDTGSIAQVVGDPGSWGINSSNGADTSQVRWLMLQNPFVANSVVPAGHTSLGSTRKPMQYRGLQLAAGTVTDAANFTITPDTVFIVQRVTQGAAAGNLDIAAQVAGDPGTITIASDDPADTGFIDVVAFDLGAMATFGPASSSRLGSATRAVVGGTTAAMVAGVVTLATRPIPVGAIMLVSRNSLAGTPGQCRVSTLTAGDPGTFTLTSSNALDTSTWNYLILNPACFG